MAKVFAVLNACPILSASHLAIHGGALNRKLGPRFEIKTLFNLPAHEREIH